MDYIFCSCYFDYVCEKCQEKLTLTNQYLIDDLSKIIIRYQRRFEFNKKYECDCIREDCIDCQYYLHKLKLYLCNDVSRIIVNYLNNSKQSLLVPLQFWFRNTNIALPQIALAYNEVKINLQLKNEI